MFDIKDCGDCSHVDQCRLTIEDCKYFTTQDAAEYEWPLVYRTTAPAIIYEEEVS